ncbi:MAG TPA: hypothetical protein VKA34_14355, partial [Balneolales bacterium]|nr:hypothetical protein [Balneolales bacterium]
MKKKKGKVRNRTLPFVIERVIPIIPGRAVRCLPAPPQIRTSRFPAYGSSAYGFATGWTGLYRPPISKPLS